MKIGLISDTHGLLRPEALHALSGVQHIIHAGDIRAARDAGKCLHWAAALPLALSLEFDGLGVHVLHDLKELGVDPAAAGFRVVIAGHSHKPAVVERDGVLFVNPGSAGPRRFKLPVAIAYLRIAAGTAWAEIREVL